MNKINSAMLLSAGFGSRMKPLSDNTPKPLIEIGGQSQIQYIYDTLIGASIENIVVNAYYLSQQVVDYFEPLNATVVVEDEILETGGGVKNAIDLLGDVFVVSNTDSIVVDDVNFIQKMAENFDDTMGGLLLVVDKNQATNYTGNGDLDIDDNGVITLNPNGQYVFCGVQILRKTAFENTPDGKFSLNVVYGNLAQKGRLKAMVHTGRWYHISTPDDVDAVNQLFAEQGKL